MLMQRTRPSFFASARAWLASTPVEHRLVCLVLVLLWVMAYASALVILDTARDLHFALESARGNVPALGPVINSRSYLSPIWFLTLAPVMALTRSATVTLAFVGLLSALKFPLAYVFGSRWRDRDLGFCLMLAVAWPSWNASMVVLPTHTALTEASVLALLLAYLMLYRGGSVFIWLAVGVLHALAMHAHPTTLVLILLAPVVAWVRLRDSARANATRLGEFASMAAGALLAWLPQLVTWYSAPATSTSLVAAIDSNVWQGVSVLVTRIGNLTFATLVKGPAEVLAWTQSTAFILLGAAVLIGAALCALIGHVRERGREWRIIWMLIFAYLGFTTIMVMVRSYTPAYMTALLSLGLAPLLALGWRSAGRFGRWLAVGSALLVPLSILMLAAQGYASFNTSRFMNVESSDTRRLQIGYLPAWALERLNRRLCETQGSLAIHGYLAALQDAALGFGHRLTCEGREAPQLAGKGVPGTRHFLSVPPDLARELALTDAHSWKLIELEPEDVLAPDEHIVPGDPNRYPPHDFITSAAVPHRLAFNSKPQRRLIITTVLPYGATTIDAVRANGASARLVTTRNITHVYECAQCQPGAPISWELDVSSSDIGSLDVVAIPVAGGG